MENDRLLGELTEHKRQVEKRLDSIENKIDSLLAFKWRILGFATFAAFAATILVEIAKARSN